MSTQKIKKKILLVLLFIATALSFSYAFNKNYDYKMASSRLKKSIEEKKELEQKLEKTTANYKKLSAKNKKLSKRVILEINKIINLKDSVDELDSDLKKDKKALAKKTHLTKKLSTKINSLATKVDKAKLLKLNIVEVLTMRKRNNSKFTTTTNKNKIDAFKISFHVLKNEIANKGKKRISIKVLDSKNNIVIIKGAKGTANTYISKLTIDYKNEPLDVVSFIEVDRKNITPGIHKVIISLEGLSVAQKTINLR